MNIKLKGKGKSNRRHNKKHIQNEKCYEYKERLEKKICKKNKGAGKLKARK